MQSGKRFFILFLIFAAGLLVLTAAFNLVVDPLAKVHIPRFGLFFSAEREIKAQFVEIFPHNAVLIGSSRTAGIDPDDINCGDLKFFNASFSDAAPEEIYNFIDRFVPTAKVVVIGLDIFMFNAGHKPYTPETFREGLGPMLKYLFSIDTLEYSLETLDKWADGEESRKRDDGQRFMDHKDRRDAKMSGIDYDEILQLMDGQHYADIRFEQRRVEVVARTRALLNERGIKSIFFWNPVNEAILELIASRADRREFYNRARHEVAAVMPDVVDLSAGQLSNTDGFYKSDPVHYYPSLGRRFILEMLAGRGLCPGAGEAGDRIP